MSRVDRDESGSNLPAVSAAGLPGVVHRGVGTGLGKATVGVIALLSWLAPAHIPLWIFLGVVLLLLMGVTLDPGGMDRSGDDACGATQSSQPGAQAVEESISSLSALDPDDEVLRLTERFMKARGGALDTLSREDAKAEPLARELLERIEALSSAYEGLVRRYLVLKQGVVSEEEIRVEAEKLEEELEHCGDPVREKVLRATLDTRRRQLRSISDMKTELARTSALLSNCAATLEYQVLRMENLLGEGAVVSPSELESLEGELEILLSTMNEMLEEGDR